MKSDTEKTNSTGPSCKLKDVFFKKQMTSDGEAPRHQYFNAHQCKLPPEKIHVYQIQCSRLRMCFLNLTAVNMEDIRAKNLFRSYTALCAEKYRQYKYYPVSIHPFSKLRIWFEAFLLIGMVVSNIALAVHFSATHPQRRHKQYLVMYLFDCIYLMNMVLNFFTGYAEGNTCQYIVLDWKKIAIKYARTWLLLDLISTTCSITGFIYMESVHPQLILVSMKLLRLPIMVVCLDNVLTILKVGIFKKTFAEIFIWILFYLTWNVFFQFAVEYMKEDSFNPVNPSNCSWISIAKIWDEQSYIRFTFALDRAIGMLRQNSNINLVEHKGCFENFFITAWIISTVLVYHGAFKYIVFLFGRESAKAKYFIMTTQVENLMNQRKFPPRIREKILKFYAIRFQLNFFAESKMLACVTGQLREDILMHTGRQLVRELEFLKQLPRALLLQIGMKLKIVIFIAGDIIFKINTVGDCLYFIDKGSVAIYSESGNEICHLEDGDYFGEIALVMKHCFRTASAVAVTNCELFRLDKEDFDSSIACYPTVYEDIKKVAISRYERACVLDEHHKAELKMEEEYNRKSAR